MKRFYKILILLPILVFVIIYFFLDYQFSGDEVNNEFHCDTTIIYDTHKLSENKYYLRIKEIITENQLEIDTCGILVAHYYMNENMSFEELSIVEINKTSKKYYYNNSKSSFIKKNIKASDKAEVNNIVNLLDNKYVSRYCYIEDGSEELLIIYKNSIVRNIFFSSCTSYCNDEDDIFVDLISKINSIKPLRTFDK